MYYFVASLSSPPLKTWEWLTKYQSPNTFMNMKPMYDASELNIEIARHSYPATCGNVCGT